jgi:PAS domain S-box-containing protein
MKTATQTQTKNALPSSKDRRQPYELLPRAGINDKYQALVNNLSVGVYRNTPGPKGHFLEANPAIVMMFEAASKEEFLQYNVSDFYADPKMRKVFAAKIMKHGSVRDEHLDLVTLKGKQFIGSVTATVTKDEHGNTCFDGIIEDITEQKKAAEILQQMEMQGRLERTLDHMVDGCQIISPDLRYVYVNQVAAQQGRKTKDELLGHMMMEVYPGIEQTKMFSHLRRCMKHRKLYSMENEFEFPDGAKGWFELKMEPVPEGVLIFSADITKRKNYEATISIRNQQLEALNKTQEDTKRALLNVMEDLKKANGKIELEKVKDRAILENIGEGLIAVDPNGKVIMVNKAAEILLGQKEAALQGKKITSLDMLDAEGQIIAPADQPISGVLKNGKTIGPSVAEYYFVGQDKRKFPLGITVTPIKLDDEIIGAIEVFRDATKEQEIDKAKTEFVSIASHQLRTPLGVAKWYLEAVEEEGYLDRLPKTGKDYLDEVYKSNERVLKVVRELLSVSRIDQGRVNDDPKPTDAVRLVKDIVHEMSPVAAGKNVRLTLRIKRLQSPGIYIDQLRLHEVIQNLIANALEYTPSGGHVAVTVGKKAHEFVISFTDTGIGIAEKDRKRLFTKFFRSEKAALQNPDGSGLGLYVVKSYVEEWGGKITVRSREGKGSAFIITLPSMRGGNDEKNTHN